MEERDPLKKVMVRLDLLDEILNKRALPREDILTSFCARKRSGEEDGFYAQIEAQLVALRKKVKEAEREGDDTAAGPAGSLAREQGLPVPTMEAIMGSFFHQLDEQHSVLEGIDSTLKELAAGQDALQEQIHRHDREAQENQEKASLDEETLKKLKYYEQLFYDIWHRTYDNRVEVENVYKETQKAVIPDEEWRRFPREVQQIISTYVNYGNYFFEFYKNVRKIFEERKGGTR